MWGEERQKHGRENRVTVQSRCLDAYSICLRFLIPQRVQVNLIACIRWWRPMGDAGVDQRCGCASDKSPHCPDTVHLSSAAAHFSCQIEESLSVAVMKLSAATLDSYRPQPM